MGKLLNKITNNPYVLKGTYSYNDLYSLAGTGCTNLKLDKTINMDQVSNSFYKGYGVYLIIGNPASDSGDIIRLPLTHISENNGKCVGCIFELTSFDWLNSNDYGSDHYKVVISFNKATLFYEHAE